MINFYLHFAKLILLVNKCKSANLASGVLINMRNTDVVYIWEEKLNFISLMSEEWIYQIIFRILKLNLNIWYA